MRTIIVDGVKYAPLVSEGERLVIAIADNHGLTFVGHFDPSQDGTYKIIRDARCIIDWGTTQHLAELAANGPTSTTRLGEKRTVHVTNVIAYYDCEAKLWS